jgi:23S rRNA (guanosine2251-2'-O)-methyltransferase
MQRKLDIARAMAKASREYIYGTNPAFEVLRAKRRKVYGAWLNQSARDKPRMQKLVRLLEQNEVGFEWVEKGRLIQLSKSTEHQGVVLKTALYPYTPKEELFTQSRLLLLDNIEDPHNVGAVLRSAEVFGFHGVCLPTRGVPEVYPSVVKVSAGATEFMQIARDASANQYARKAAETGYQIVALDMNGSATMEAVREADPKKLMLVIGGEDKSVGQFILNMADHVVGIPQSGRVNSLNASVAAGIAMCFLGNRT